MDFSSEKAYHDVCLWLNDNHDLPTAFFAFSDVIAFGDIRAFNRFDYKVPGDVSVIGFDDMPRVFSINMTLFLARLLSVVKLSASG